LLLMRRLRRHMHLLCRLTIDADILHRTLSCTWGRRRRRLERCRSLCTVLTGRSRGVLRRRGRSRRRSRGERHGWRSLLARRLLMHLHGGMARLRLSKPSGVRRR
jgi:hypothetical protein